MSDCVFCKIISGEIPAYKFYEDEHTIAFLDIHPSSEFHTLVIPKKHFADIFDIPASELGHVAEAIKHVSSILKEKVGVNHAQVINNSGSHAQQEVFHIHFHIIPREAGDGKNIHFQKPDELAKKLPQTLLLLTQ